MSLSLSPPLDLDDAFAESDDGTSPRFQFTAARIRDDMANLPDARDWGSENIPDFGIDNDFASRIGFAEDFQTSGIDRRDEERSPSPTRSPSPDSHSESPTQENIVYPPFSSVILGSETLAPSVESEPPVLHESEALSPSPGPSSVSQERQSFEVQGHLPPPSEASEPPASIESLSPRSPMSTYSAPPSTPQRPDNDASAPSSNPVVIDASAAIAVPAIAVSAASTSSLPPLKGPTSPRHRVTKSTGPSTFEKVMSKTRPIFLPPKNKEEDLKHLADWEAMMRRSRDAEEKRRKEAEDRRIAREKKVEESLHIWQKDIVPNWKAVQTNPQLRKLWWAGIPTTLRATMWERAVGNPLALSKDNFRTCLARAKRALSSKVFPVVTMEQIDADIRATLPGLHIFKPDSGPLHDDLKDMLCAWVVARSDEGLGYIPGIARIAGMILLQMPPAPGFIVMRNLLERHCLRCFYGGVSTKEDVEAYYRIFDTLLADGMPKIYFNFKQHQISPAAYLPEWLLPLFLDHLPFEACARIWDVIILEGDSFLFRTALAILAVLEPRLFFPDREALLTLLRGEDRAALEVARRNGLRPDGGKYEIYAVDEEAVWERLGDMQEWWRDSTWKRLLSRELPDV